EMRIVPPGSNSDRSCVLRTARLEYGLQTAQLSVVRRLNMSSTELRGMDAIGRHYQAAQPEGWTPTALHCKKIVRVPSTSQPIAITHDTHRRASSSSDTPDPFDRRLARL